MRERNENAKINDRFIGVTLLLEIIFPDIFPLIVLIHTGTPSLSKSRAILRSLLFKRLNSSSENTRLLCSSHKAMLDIGEHFPVAVADFLSLFQTSRHIRRMDLESLTHL